MIYNMSKMPHTVGMVFVFEAFEALHCSQKVFKMFYFRHFLALY